MLTGTICAICKPHFRAWESHTGSQIPVSKKLYMVSVWILVIRRVGNEKFVQNLIIEVKVQEMSLKMKAKKDSSGKLSEQSARLIWASGSILLVLYLAPSPSSKCSRWPRELPLGNWILSTGLSAGTTPHALSSGWTQTRFDFFSDQRFWSSKFDNVHCSPPGVPVNFSSCRVCGRKIFLQTTSFR